MAVKNIGTEINRTNTVFLDAATDFGPFGVSYNQIVLRGDPARAIYVTGFVHTWIHGAVADINANHITNVFCCENKTFNADPALETLFPGVNASLRFAFGETAFQNVNQVKEQFETPFKLIPGVTYSFLGTVQIVAAIVGPVTSRFTVFGIEEEDYKNLQTFYKSPR